MAVKVYVPAIAEVTFVIDGLFKVEVKPLGPAQLQPVGAFTPPSAAPFKVKVFPVHTGFGLAKATTPEGKPETDTSTVAGIEVQPPVT